MTMEDEVLDGGDILIRDGKIASVGYGLSAVENEETIDAGGTWVLPGFVDPHCHIGLWEWGMGFEGDDGNEAMDPVTPQLRAIDSINPVDKHFKMALRHGVTTVVTGPGSANVIGGQFLAMKTHGSRVDDMIIKAPTALKVAFGENPKRVYHKQNKSPITRMATAAILREQLIKGQDYIRKQELGQLDPTKMPDRDLKLEIIASVLKREIPLKCHAHRADDILTAIRICKEFNLDYTLDHCTEGYLIADILKAEGAKVIVGPLLTDASKIELTNISFEAPAILHKAGIRTALMSDHPVLPSMYLPLQAALTVRAGLDEMEALKSITIYAAEINGIANRVGSIKVGKDADIVLYDGNPLDIRIVPQRVIVDGKTVFHDGDWVQEQ